MAKLPFVRHLFEGFHEIMQSILGAADLMVVAVFKVEGNPQIEAVQAWG